MCPLIAYVVQRMHHKTCSILLQLQDFRSTEYETHKEEISLLTVPFYKWSFEKQCEELGGLLILTGTAVAQLLGCRATNRKVAGSIPNGVIGIFH
jgi:hypothetical protein